MTFEKLLNTFFEHGAKLVATRKSGSLIEFMVYTIFIPKPMNGVSYETDELKHNLANYRSITEGEIYTDFTSIFQFNEEG